MRTVRTGKARVTSKSDIVVVGAGIVGVSAAINLARRGRRVTLLDRREPGEETSFGNAGVIEGGTYVPMAMPFSPAELIRYARNDRPEMHFHWRFLPRIAPWLVRLALNSTEAKLRRNGGAVMALLAHAIGEHKSLMREAGAGGFLRETGWIRLYRSEDGYAGGELERLIARESGFAFTAMTRDETLEVEPHLTGDFYRADHWHDIASLSDPGGVTKAYASLLTRYGSEFRRGEVRRLVPVDGGWRVDTAEGGVVAGEVVVAAGPWSMDLLGPLGYRLPFAVKRGYHTHYRPAGNAALGRPVVDSAYGYCMTPMVRGVRITTGVEFADRDAPPTPSQAAAVEPHARELFPLGEAVDDEPWMGRRPCFPDTLPVVGPAPRHKGLWLDFGHAHLGMTLGPVTGRLLAELVTGVRPVVDPAPYAATRF